MYIFCFYLSGYPPWKLTCPPKRDHFFKDMDHLRTINFQGIFVGSMVGGWWFMWKFSWRPAHTVAITERRKPLGFISKPFKRRYPLFLSCCTFCKNLHLLNHHPEFFILFWRDIYHDSDGRTEINFRKVLVQCFMLVSRLKSRHMLHDMAIAKSNSRWWFQISFVLSLLWGNDPIWLRFFQRDWNHQLDFLYRFHVWTWTNVPRMALPTESSLGWCLCWASSCRMLGCFNLLDTEFKMTDDIQAKCIIFL